MSSPAPPDPPQRPDPSSGYVVTAHYEPPPAPPRPPHAAAATARRRRRVPRWAWITLIVLAASTPLVVIALVAPLLWNGFQMATAQPPGVGTVIVAPDESKAARAAAAGDATPEQAAAAAYLAAQPTAYWLTPEQDPIGEVGPRVLHLADEAREAERALAVVVYGLPERDCGNHSAGGLDTPGYQRWTTEIGEALRSAPDVQKIVVVEPDSLALAPECGNVAERVEQLRAAIGRLTGADTWLYVDGGHSNWLGVDAMADLIRQVDTGQIRGFVTNVSNFNHTSDEFDYARSLSARVGGLHAIIDTSRNGAGSNGQWCNPTGRLVGDPGGTYGDEIVDTNLWIKPPGESDGPCNGGPAAGVWWPAGAVDLTREAAR